MPGEYKTETKQNKRGVWGIKSAFRDLRAKNAELGIQESKNKEKGDVGGTLVGVSDDAKWTSSTQGCMQDIGTSGSEASEVLLLMS